MTQKAPQRSAQAVSEGLDPTMIRRVVEEFYALAREDEVLGPVFRAHVPDAQWAAHLDKITAFWTALMLGGGGYSGRPMGKHLAIDDLGDRHFARWLAVFRHTVTTLCPPQTAQMFIDRSERIAASFRINIAMHRGQDLVFAPPLKRESYP